jgi:P27 family predicted phage terminase small subunit
VAGRRPKPFALHKLHGNPRKWGAAEMAARANEPTGASGIPEMPKGLNDTARRWFQKFAEDALAIRTLTVVDTPALAGVAQAMAEAEDAQAIVDKFGLVVEEPIINHKTGELLGTKLVKNPAVAVLHAAWSRVKGFATMLGLSPDSRSKIKTAGDAAEVDPFEAMLNARPQVGFAPEQAPTAVNEDPRITRARKLSPEYDIKCANAERAGKPVTLDK